MGSSRNYTGGSLKGSKNSQVGMSDTWGPGKSRPSGKGHKCGPCKPSGRKSGY